MNKKLNKIINITVKICFVILLISIPFYSYSLGVMGGTLTGIYSQIGTEGVCDILDYAYMEDGRCVLSNYSEERVMQSVDCNFGEFRIYSEKPYKYEFEKSIEEIRIFFLSGIKCDIK